MLFVVMAVAISALLTIIFYVFTSQSFKQQIKNQIQRELVNIDYYVNDSFNTHLVRDLRLFGANPLVDEFIMSSPAEKELLSRSLEKIFSNNINYNKSVIGQLTVATGRRKL